MRARYVLKIGRFKVTLGERTLVMGVLNMTPDSFSDGGLYLSPQRAIERGVEMARQGADWLDIGGESTRPGSKPVPAKEELRRVLPVIRALHKKLPALPISIDTTKAEVAEEAVGAGAAILNDVSGLRFDPRLADVARRHGTPLVLMHMRGRPATMQQKPFAKFIWKAVRQGLARAIRAALAAGVRRSQLILDPGFGFGKSRRQNFEMLAGLDRLRSFHLPILVGTSRKSFVRAIVAGEELALETRKSKLEIRPPGTNFEFRISSFDLLVGNAAAVVAAILAGAHIVRIHDVEAILPAVRIADAVLLTRRLNRDKV